MRRHTQYHNYRSYSFLFPSSTYSRNNYYQYYNPRLRFQPAYHSHLAPISTYTTPRSQYQSVPLTTILSLPEPITVFDNVELSKDIAVPVVPALPVIYRRPDSSRQSNINNERLVRASAMRERLLKDIQQSISEIDQELSSLKGRSTGSRFISPRLPPIEDKRDNIIPRTAPMLSDDERFWPQRPKRIYQVVPRITSEVRKTSLNTTPRFIENISPELFTGPYHYGQETDEMDILDDDHENPEFKSSYEEISQLSTHEAFPINRYNHGQSDSTRNRALVRMPNYIDNLETRITELTEELRQRNMIDANILQSSTTSTVNELTSVRRYNTEDAPLPRKTVSEPNMQISSENISTTEQPSSNKVESSLNNTIVSKPIKHLHLPITTEGAPSSSSQPTKTSNNQTTTDTNHISNNVTTDLRSKEQRHSVDTGHLTVSTELETLLNDNRKKMLMREFHPSQQRQLEMQTDENNNQHVEETEQEKIDITTKPSVTPISTAASMKTFPISIYDDMQIQTTRNNNNSNEDQREK